MNEAARNADLLRAWRACAFELSAARLGQLPRGGREVAFAGRSNAGKSSALNVLADHAGLARTSKTPGRTQLINIFSLDPLGRLADLPGYGFAKAPRAVQQQWTTLVESYFARREELCGVVVIVDCRRGLSELDRQLLDWIGPRLLRVHVLLSKADKLGRGEAARTLQSARRELQALNPLYSAQLFSATRRQGIDEARRTIAELLKAVPA